LEVAGKKEAGVAEQAGEKTEFTIRENSIQRKKRPQPNSRNIMYDLTTAMERPGRGSARRGKFSPQ